MAIDARSSHRGLFCRVSAIVLSAVGGFVASPAAAQTPLPGIVVEGATLSNPPVRRSTPAVSAPAQGGGASGTTEQADAGGDGVAAEKIGSAVSVITGEELQRRQIRNAADALRSMPGVYVSRSAGFGGETQVRLRGAEANHTLVLIDGMVANQPGTGEFDFALLSTDQIERIEIIRGAQSGLYGSGAIGGAINIVTKTGKRPPKGSIWSEAGSYKTVAGGVTLSGGTDRAHGLISYSATSSNGFNIADQGWETDAFSRRSFLFKGGVKPTDTFAVDFFLRNSEKRGDRDDDLFCPFPAPPTCTGFSKQIDSFSHFATSSWLTGVEARLDSFGGALTHKFKVNYAETNLEDTSGPFFSRNDNDRSNFAYSATWKFDTPGVGGAAKHFLTGLVEKEMESFTPVTGDNRSRERDRLATAAEYRGEFANRLFIAGNVRHDDNDSFKDFTTWRTSASLALREFGLRPHASVGTGVRLPTMVEQFGQFTGFVSNPNLQPEESFGWDAGIEYSFLKGRAVLDVTYFNTDFRNEIFTDFSLFPIIGVDNRSGKSTREGVEVALRWQIMPSLTIGGAYTWLDARDDAGFEEIRRPKNTGRVDVSYGFAEGRGNVTLAAIYNGQARDFAFELPFFTQTRVALGEYWLVSAAASWKLQPGVEVFGRVENLLDEHYQEVYGFETARIAAYAGVKITFGGEDGLALASGASR
ncbi:MAG: TonB-dependent receptor plug domain-containing protein [Hyphomicrobiaceae bacterium]